MRLRGSRRLPLTGPVLPVGERDRAHRSSNARRTGLSGRRRSRNRVVRGRGHAARSPRQNLATSNNRPRDGKRVLISATVINAGDLPASASQTEIKRDETVVLGRVGTPALAPGQSANVSVEWDTRHQQGDHVIPATADWNNAVAESDEANNTREITVTVRGNHVRNATSKLTPTATAVPTTGRTRTTTGTSRTQLMEPGRQSRAAQRVLDRKRRKRGSCGLADLDE